MGIDRWREPPPDPDMAELVTWHGWWADFQAAPTSGDALRICVENEATILRRVAPLLPAMRGSAGDPDAAGFMELNDERRIESVRESLKVVLGKPPGLRHGLTIRAATEIFAALFSPEVYHALSARGWSHRRCTDFFQQLLASQLLALDPT